MLGLPGHFVTETAILAAYRSLPGAKGQHGIQAAEGEGLRQSYFCLLRRGLGSESRPGRIPDPAG